MDLKRLLFVVVAAVLVCGCARVHRAADADGRTDSVEVVANKLVCPLPLSLSADSLTDCTIAASFTADDFRWMGGSLQLVAYEEIVYDAADVCSLREGDTLLYQEQELDVQSVEQSEGSYLINGGANQGGATLCPLGGGTFYAVESHNRPLYRLIGSAEVPLDEDFTIHDYADDPHAPQVYVAEAQKPYIDMLEGARREFDYRSTRVMIEGGMITDITRRAMPINAPNGVN